MTRLVVVAHHPLATALRLVASHVYPDCVSRLVCVDILANDDLERATARVREALGADASTADDTSQTLCMVDVMGATPAHAARAAMPGVHMVTGVNVPMLWRTLCYGDEPVERLCERALEGAARGTTRWQDEA